MCWSLLLFDVQHNVFERRKSPMPSRMCVRRKPARGDREKEKWWGNSRCAEDEVAIAVVFDLCQGTFVA